MTGRHQHHQALGAKRQRYHALTVQDAVIHTDLAFVGHHYPQHIHALVLDQLQVDFRVVRQERPQHGGQQCAVGHGGSRQAQGDAVLTRQLVQGALQLLRLSEDGSRALEHQPPGWR
ncbi:hypothetical protein D3C81_1392930 [compost metagenome]